MGGEAGSACAGLGQDDRRWKGEAKQARNASADLITPRAVLIDKTDSLTTPGKRLNEGSGISVDNTSNLAEQRL